ncbi:Peptidase S8/S53 domain [Macleaya cordata]|uniref:Peptidase S8/S53 domain n=1 Tax=Macleaya cordata TaxID=56857 RepID=A0A200QH55_MACCD|nr:Peptidase S8/S53 domain [Macleaya cordata]
MITMGSRRLFLSLLFIFVFSLLGRTTLATKKAYVVYLGSHDHGPEPASTHFAKAEEYHYEFLASILGSKEKAKDALIYSYTKYINGFAANLEEEEAAKLEKHPDVISVFLSQTRRLHTTHSSKFLGVDIIEGEPWWKTSHTGSDVIIGSLDTGVWPESESFRDDGMGPVPARWKGSCQNNTKSGVPCNRKLIGAKYFDKGYRAMMAEINNLYPGPLTARDTVGHGTHTLSTAAGRPVPGANLFGFGNGTARGPLPNARVAAYKVCWPPANENSTECCDIDILAGFDAAIHDGVDIISASLAQPAVNLDGSQLDYWKDSTAIGAFHAVKHGIVVVCSAGNDGPNFQTVSNVAPWIITVGASVMDRGFSNYVQLGNNKRYKGQSLSTASLPENKLYPLVIAAKEKVPDADDIDALLCKPGTLDPEKVKGKIVACMDGDLPRVVKGSVVADAGGVGMVLLNSLPSDVYPELHLHPASHVFENATFITDYIYDSPNPTAYISNPADDFDLKPAPALACFSSRGPNSVTPDVLKPDIIAPGMSILAAFSPEAVPSDILTDSRRVLFNVLSGTSMASPHVAGIVGIIKTAHPDWSPSEIKSALMTTSRTRDRFSQTIRDQCTTQAEADPFGYGAGHVRPIRALDPGLVYELAMHDYWNFFCSIDYKAEQFAKFFKKSYSCPKSSCILDFNYPAITVTDLTGSVTISRVLKNVGTPGTYTASIIEPWGISVTVEPKTLKFDKVGEKKMFWLTIKAMDGMKPKTYVFGKLKWSDGVHSVRSPISVKLEQEWYRIQLLMQLFLSETYTTIKTKAIELGVHSLKSSYVVYLGGHSHGAELSSIDLDRVTESHHEFLGSFLGSQEKAKKAMFYSYNRHINGFAANLEEEEAEEISKHPDVISVFLNKEKKLHTTNSWEFLGLEKNGEVFDGSLWKKARFGEDVIIGNIDTGVWPESESFSDEGMGPIPAKWKGFCQNNTKLGVPCNRKLIGARYFNKGYNAYRESLDYRYHTARDIEGHGTHTLSTAGGGFVNGANVFGLGNGTAKGGSPKARVAAYKVCWPPINKSPICPDADIIAAFDAAIHDKVDVLSISLGENPTDYLSDSIAIGSFHAVKNGITVVCSAGNTGPTEGDVGNVAPWILTVGASTIDRDFPSYVYLGNKMHLKVTNIYNMREVIAPPLRTLPYSAPFYGTHMRCILRLIFLENKTKGKIVVCVRGTNSNVAKGKTVLEAGGVGMVLVNDERDSMDFDYTELDPHVLPASHLASADGLSLFSYIDSTESPQAYITPPRTQLNVKPAPVIAFFSARGPNSITPEILKPDIIAPGVSIIAAFSQALGPSIEPFDKRRVSFNTMSGTSMSCPLVSGIVGLLKTLHPDWSPAAIKSAIMTTARSRSNAKTPILTASGVRGVPFSYGAGLIRPNSAMDPGLVYDLTIYDYLNFLCAVGYDKAQIAKFTEEKYNCKSISLLDFNYPSIIVPKLYGPVTVTRTVKNVGPPGTYTVNVTEPYMVSVNVEPKSLTFEKMGEEKTFKVTLKVKGGEVIEDFVVGRLVWSDSVHYVRSPIVVMEGI